VLETLAAWPARCGVSLSQPKEAGRLAACSWQLVAGDPAARSPQLVRRTARAWRGCQAAIVVIDITGGTGYPWGRHFCRRGSWRPHGAAGRRGARRRRPRVPSSSARREARAPPIGPGRRHLRLAPPPRLSIPHPRLQFLGRACMLLLWFNVPMLANPPWTNLI